MQAPAASLAAALLAVACLPPPELPQEATRPVSDDPALLYAPHREDGRFGNPWGRFRTGFGDLLRFGLSRSPWDKGRVPELPVVANDGRELAGVQHSSKLTWVGHATFAIHDGADVVLTDPHFGPRALLPRRRVPPGVPIEAIPPDAMAVLSHNHYDHLDAWTVDHLPESIAWFVPLGLADWFRARGREQVVELDWWQSAERGRWKITCLPAQHWSRRVGQGTNSTLWCSWLLESGSYRYYFAGDTGYFHGFAEFGRRFGPIDVAMLPIGAYEPRWFMRYQHMNPEEAWRAFQDLGAETLLPMHWGTFDLTHEPLDEPPRALRRAIEAAGGDPGRAPVLAVGEGFHVPHREPLREAAAR